MINSNGELLSEQEAKLSVFNRGLAYGDALFETIKTLNGKILFWEDHYFRLMASMRILRMEIPSIKVGEKANLTLFDPSLSYVYEEKEIVSRSKNSPFIGKKLTGKALGILHNSLNS